MDSEKITLQSLKPLRGKVLVGVNYDEKKEHKLADGVSIQVERQFDWDGKMSQNTFGIIMHDYENVNSGTMIVINHNACIKETCLPVKYGKYDIYSIDAAQVYAYVIDGAPHPFDGYFLVDRLEELKEKSVIYTEHTEKKHIHNKFLVKEIGVNDDIKEGDVAICYTMSDYELPYNNNGRLEYLIRVKVRDVVAVEKFDKTKYAIYEK
jgi:hypothetical protein